MWFATLTNSRGFLALDAPPGVSTVFAETHRRRFVNRDLQYFTDEDDRDLGGVPARTATPVVASRVADETAANHSVRSRATRNGVLHRADGTRSSHRGLHDGDAAERGHTEARPFDAALVQLVCAAQRGDEHAFEQLWLRYAASVQTILLTMVSQQEAEDLAQETAVVALDALQRLDNPGSFPAWLHTIARNLGRDALAKRRRTAGWSTIEDESIAAPIAGDSTVAEEILDAIRSLPESHREPLMLRLVLEMTGAEIAAHTGMTEGSVRVNLCRGMKILRARLGADVEGFDG